MALATSLRKTTISRASIAKSFIPPLLWRQIYQRLIVGKIADAALYQPLYSPWLAPEFVATYREISPFTMVSIERCWTLNQMLAQALNVEGDVMEAGVFQGGTARLLKDGMADASKKGLRLFDSFQGMEHVSRAADRHREGDFTDTSLDRVKDVVGREPSIDYRQGWIPQTFAGLESNRFCFAHIDLDLHRSILDCLEFVYPRLSPGGILIFDDYGFPSCPGARRAVEEFFAARPERPLALMTGQALVVKL